MSLLHSTKESEPWRQGQVVAGVESTAASREENKAFSHAGI